jgi:hypothetical protein
MLIGFLLTISMAFLWLMVETKWLTIRLAMGIPMLYSLIACTIGLILLPIIDE